MQSGIKLTGVKWASTFNWQPGMFTAQLAGLPGMQPMN